MDPPYPVRLSPCITMVDLTSICEGGQMSNNMMDAFIATFISHQQSVLQQPATLFFSLHFTQELLFSRDHSYHHSTFEENAAGIDGWWQVFLGDYNYGTLSQNHVCPMLSLGNDGMTEMIMHLTCYNMYACLLHCTYMDRGGYQLSLTQEVARFSFVIHIPQITLVLPLLEEHVPQHLQGEWV